MIIWKLLFQLVTWQVLNMVLNTKQHFLWRKSFLHKTAIISTNFDWKKKSQDNRSLLVLMLWFYFSFKSSVFGRTRFLLIFAELHWRMTFFFLLRKEIWSRIHLKHLTHSFSMHSFSTPWKHKKTVRFSGYFQGVEQGCIGKEWVNGIMGLMEFIWYLNLNLTTVFLPRPSE